MMIDFILVVLRYGDVFWTMMDPVALDKGLVERFGEKTMAIVGYETDQVLISLHTLSTNLIFR